MTGLKKIFSTLLNYLGRKILLYCIGVGAIVGVTFLFTKKFSIEAFSDRMVWAGLFLFIASTVVWLGVFAAGREFGIQGLIKKPEEAKSYYAHQNEIQEIIEKRYDAAIQVWLTGLTCILIGALVDVFASRLF